MWARERLPNDGVGEPFLDMLVNVVTALFAFVGEVFFERVLFLCTGV